MTANGGITRDTCPFCDQPLSEPESPADHGDWCRDNQSNRPRLDIQQYIKPIQHPCRRCGGAR